MNDILGLKSYGEAVATVTKKTFEGIEAFLSATCKPALDELGLMLRDQVCVWRLNNALKIVEKAKDKLEFKLDVFRRECKLNCVKLLFWSIQFEPILHHQIQS